MRPQLVRSGVISEPKVVPFFQEVRMQKNARRRWFHVLLLPVMFASTLTVAADPEPSVVVPPVIPDCDAASVVAPVTPAAPLPVAGGGALDSTPAADSSKCCDPALEPGVGGNPLCFEGHTCCASGQWQCNNADGSPSCTGGQTCGSTCGTTGSSCNANADCCSGQCKGNHKCR